MMDAPDVKDVGAGFRREREAGAQASRRDSERGFFYDFYGDDEVQMRAA